MTIGEAAAMLERLGVSNQAHVPHLPPVVQQPPRLQASPRHLDAIAKLERSHAAKMAALKEKNDKRIRDQQQHRDELLAENRLHKRLLREASMFEQSEEDRVELAQRRGFRDFLEGLGSTPGDREKQQLEDELSGVVDETHTPEVQKMVAWLNDMCEVGHIDVRECRDPRIINGSASRRGRWITRAPIKNKRLATIRAHEVAHILHPDIEERIVTADDGYHKISVPCEIAAWRWVLDNVPVWSAAPYFAGTRRFSSSSKCSTTTICGGAPAASLPPALSNRNL